MYGSVYGSMHGPVQAVSYSGSYSPHVPVPEDSGDCHNIDVNRHPQTAPLHDVINHAPLPTLLIPRAPSQSSEGSGLQSPPADSDDSDRRDRMGDVKLPYTRFVAYKVPKAKTKREPDRCHAYRVNALVRDKNPRSSVKRDTSGSVQGAYRDFGTHEKIRSPSHAGTRSATAVTRALGACGRCRGQKLKCTVPENVSESMFMPCGRCAALQHRHLKAPCIRVNILDLNLHRRGSTLNDRLKNWTLAQEKVYLTQVGLQRLETLDVVITQDQGIEIPVTIRRFSSRPGDTTAWTWRDSNLRERVMEMPQFYICDYHEAARNMREAVVYKKAEYVDYLLGVANPILRKTFEAAFRYLEVSTNSLVLDCLTFWVATRFIEKPWRICHGTLPGFEPPYEPLCPYSGIIPVTPIMDTQIDDIAITTLLNPLGKKILKQLSCKIHEKKRENWFDIYLATFILMNNFEFVFTDVLEYTSRHGLKSSSSSGAASLSKAYFNACKTILVYFHFACNGQGPFSLACNDKLTGATDGLTFDQQAYLRDLKLEVDRQRNTLEGWRAGSVYRTPLYLCYQVLVEKWSADVSHSEPIDDFTEEDFLTS
ncbi:hypothetical protein F4818DRAFT_446760 [Hypoxylon cercidicola]|nr:hypothetical protein F4818DRAFT_446760 [Hypoxylon cercidicola]